MPDDLMRYDLLAQDALRGVVRAAIARVVEQKGLPGEHHFYIAFDTNYPGVGISERLHKKYPREMTIIIQHQYWNLGVTDRDFTVELSFDKIPEKLVVPFAAVKGFLDPYVQFGLQFEAVAVDAAGVAAPPEKTAGLSHFAAPAETEPTAPKPETSEPNIVSLDAFRKKP